MIKYKFEVKVSTDSTVFDVGTTWKLDKIVVSDGGYTAYIIPIDDWDREIGSTWAIPLLVLHCCCKKIID